MLFMLVTRLFGQKPVQKTSKAYSPLPSKANWCVSYCLVGFFVFSFFPGSIAFILRVPKNLLRIVQIFVFFSNFALDFFVCFFLCFWKILIIMGDTRCLISQCVGCGFSVRLPKKKIQRKVTNSSEGYPLHADVGVFFSRDSIWSAGTEYTVVGQPINKFLLIFYLSNFTYR